MSTLQVVFPLEFNNLSLSDRPDLIDFDAHFGIEVVHPIDEKHKMLDSYYHNHMYGKTLAEISPKGLQYFQSNSYDIVLDSLSNTVSAYKSPCIPFDIEIIFGAIDKKMKKLNANLYTYANNTSLFLEMSMYSKEIANYSVAKNILTYVKKINPDYSISFKEIFLNCIIKLYRIDVEKEKITEIDTFELIDLIELKYEKNRTFEEISLKNNL